MNEEEKKEEQSEPKPSTVGDRGEEPSESRPDGKGKAKPNMRQLLYVPREDGEFDQEVRLTPSIDEAWELHRDWQDGVYKKGFAQMLARELSPVGLYIALLDMGVPDVAARMGLSKRKVRSHMTHNGFKKVTVRQLEGYSDVFGVPVAAFFCFAEPDMPALPVDVEEKLDGLMTLLKSGEISDDWTFLRTPAGRTL